MGESPGSVPCRGCGGALEAEAKFCARCGRSRDLTDATMIELRPLGMGATFEQTAIVTTRPPDRRRTLSLLGAVGVIALVAFGLVKTFADDSGDEATSPTSTLPATTTIPEATTAPPTTAAPATTAPRTTTSFAPPATTTTIPYVNQRQGVVLDAAQNGQSLYVVNGVELYRIELGTGRVTTRRFTGLNNAIQLYGVVDGRLVLGGVNAQALGWVAGDLSGDVTNIDLGSFSMNSPSWVTDDGIWVWRSAAVPGVARVVRRIDLTGKVRAEVRLPEDVYPVGFLGDRVVIGRYGRIWTVGTDGRAVPYANGALLTVQGGMVLWTSCDDDVRCTFHLGNATNPDVGRTSLETTYLASAGEGGLQNDALAPDGNTVVAFVLNDGMIDGPPKIVDLATGATLELSGNGSSNVGWTRNGDWLIEPIAAGGFVGTNVRTGRKVSVAYPAAFPSRNNLPAVVVG